MLHALIAKHIRDPLLRSEETCPIDGGFVKHQRPRVAQHRKAVAVRAPLLSRQFAHLAEAHNLPVTSHGAHDLTVHLLPTRWKPRLRPSQMTMGNDKSNSERKSFLPPNDPGAGKRRN